MAKFLENRLVFLLNSYLVLVFKLATDFELLNLFLTLCIKLRKLVLEKTFKQWLFDNCTFVEVIEVKVELILLFYFLIFSKSLI